jgi:uncharacterized protein YjbJ (UPF0337 family)
MNEDIFKGQWNQMKGRIKESWGKLTDDEIQQINGRQDLLLGKLQEKYGWSRMEAQNELDRFMRESERNR